MPETVRFEGFKELDEKLQSLGAVVARDLTAEALRVGAEVIQQDAQRRVPKRTGRLAQAIKVRIQKTAKGVVTATIGISRRGKVWYGALIEETGAAPHIETPTAKGGKRVLANADHGLIFGRRVTHPGFRARPFLRPALDERGAEAVQRAGETLWARIQAHLAQAGR